MRKRLLITMLAITLSLGMSFNSFAEEIVCEETDDTIINDIIDIQTTESYNNDELKTEKITAGEYYIKSRLDTNFRAYNNSKNLVMTDSKNSSDGVYVFELTDDGYYKIKNKSNGRYLSSAAALTQQEGTGDHYKVILTATCSNDNQKWIIQKSTSGYYLLMNKAKLMYLDVQDACAYYGNNVNLFYRNDAYYAQDWELKLIKATVVNAGWKKTSGGWKYQNSDGSYVKNAWESIGGKWYHFNTNGYMQTGWQKISNSWYFFNSSGVMVTGWYKSGTTWYYFKSSGAMATGWQKIGTKYYYFNTSGAMQKSKWVGNYYLQSDGSMATSKWIGNYYVDSTGKWVKGKTR